MSKLWSFWFNKPNKTMPPYIQLCIKYMKMLNADKFELITENNLYDYISETEIPKKLFDLDIVCQNEYIRTYLLYKYGGIYSDADCIHLKPIYMDMANKLDNIDYDLYSWPGGTAFMIGKMGSILLEKSIEKFNKLIYDYKIGDKIPYAYFGGGQIQRVAIDNKMQNRWKHLKMELIKPENNRVFRTARDPDSNELIIWTYGCNSYNNYYNCVDKFSFEYIMSNKAKMVMLYNRYMQNFKHKTTEEILEKEGLMFDLFRYMENYIK